MIHPPIRIACLRSLGCQPAYKNADQPLVPAAEAVTITRSLPHGNVAAAAMARELDLPALLGPAGRQRDLALALVISRVVAPVSKLSTLTWRADTTWRPWVIQR